MSSIKKLDRYTRLNEAFEARKFQSGRVNFSAHQITDPHIQKAIDIIVKQTKLPKAELEKQVADKVAEFADIAQKAPLLYGTIVKNIVEDTSFNLMEEHQALVETAPKFDRTIFFKLIRRIKADHEQFFPMRSFLNHKRLYEPTIVITPDAKFKYLNSCTTACATPKGVFAFNGHFMQQLIDWAHIKNVQPKGLKYVANGGDIPNEYCYIEFVIIHEFMHYTYDDFHYQKMIPNANATIINWVGDFRTNYLLVKSGYEQLPMGLFNDEINYDRQKTYKEMYDLVEAEFKKLGKDEQEKVKNKLNEQSDDHAPGTSEGGEMEEGEGEPVDDIDKQNDKVERQMKDSRDKTPGEAREIDREKKPPSETSNRGERQAVKPGEIDYTKIKPKFNWKELIKQFISTADVETEETYMKPSRRSISGMHTAAQMGAGAMKPGEMPLDLKKAKIAFCIDSSGSMSHIIESVYANINNLLRSNAPLQSAEFTLMKFSGVHNIYKAIFKGDKAVEVKSINESPRSFDKKLSQVFKEHFGSVTNFTPELVADLSTLLKNKYNVMIFSDSDITNGENLTELLKLFKVSGGKLFIIFDSKTTYIKFRQNAKFSTAYITYVEAD